MRWANKKKIDFWCAVSAVSSPDLDLMGRQKKKLSDFDENGTNRLESIKSGANLSSDEKVDFLKN